MEGNSNEMEELELHIDDFYYSWTWNTRDSKQKRANCYYHEQCQRISQCSTPKNMPRRWHVRIFSPS